MFAIPDFQRYKTEGRRIAMLTSYDAVSSALLETAGIDAVLVGDSVAMVLHGLESTIPASIPMIEAHVRAVRAGSATMCVIADMPFLSTRLGLRRVTEAAGRFMKAGANGVKIEGLQGHEKIVPHLIGSGIPVMGHLGLTPQSFNIFGGYKVQGKNNDDAQRIFNEAKALEALGCFALVLECIPSSLAGELSRALRIPTIGIGAGAATDGQILVINDMVGYTNRKSARFVRKYADVASVYEKAIREYIDDVRNAEFPAPSESYGEGGDASLPKGIIA